MSTARVVGAVAIVAVGVLGFVVWRQDARLQAMEARLAATAPPAPAPVFRRERATPQPQLKLNPDAARELAAALGKALALDPAGVDQMTLVLRIYMAREAAEQLAARKSRTSLSDEDVALAAQDLAPEVARLGLDPERRARLGRALPSLDRLAAAPR